MRPPSALRDPALRPLVLAQLVSLTGTHVTALALPTLAVLLLDAGPVAAALIFALEYAARGLTAPLTGVLVDRVRSPRRLLVGTDLLHAAVVATVPVLYLLDGLSLPYLVVVAGISGILAGVTDIAVTAVLPRLVAADRLVGANAALAGARAAGQILGPALGGLLVQALGAALAVAVDTATHLGSAAVLGRLRGAGRPAGPAPATRTAGPEAASRTYGPEAATRTDGPVPAARCADGAAQAGHGDQATPGGTAARTGRRAALRRSGADLRRALREGLDTFREHPLLARLALAAAALNVGGAGLGALYTLYAYRTLGLSPFAVGALWGVNSAAAMLAVGTARRVVGRLGLGRTIALFAPVAAGSLLLIPAASLVAAPLVPFVAYELLFGFCATVWAVASATLQQRLVPTDRLGRAIAFSRTVSILAVPVGALVGGVAAQLWGLPGTLTGFALLALAGTTTVVRGVRDPGNGPPAVGSSAGTGRPDRDGPPDRDDARTGPPDGDGARDRDDARDGEGTGVGRPQRSTL
ncbi:MFS transporter [Micromonospora cathayae]|uniref:MFS transporter n=1 Tax=Micromonospora cathayae TaxID=3028804 RepID=A0ABY7ZLQ2_9ACTN|nr:MFS transporter [Micromonospora sp. HUAS 3]WDZ83217.1 MFS transporter [Micromonospora sp. HUAS 3]